MGECICRYTIFRSNFHVLHMKKETYKCFLQIFGKFFQKLFEQFRVIQFLVTTSFMQLQ